MRVAKPEALAAVSKLIGRSAAMRELRQLILQVAPAPIPLLILGETGTGKEVCAEAIVRAGGLKPFIRVNCATLPDSLADNELFGHERGAFTDARNSQSGLIAQANGGVLFLDELAELSLTVQAKLLRALESGEYRPLGSTRLLKSSFRLLAATNGDIDALVADGKLRIDLVNRLDGLRITLPPLRERPEDIPLFAEHFLARYRERDPESPGRIASAAMEVLVGHSWEGNVRRLLTVVEAAAALAAPGPRLDASHILDVFRRSRCRTEPVSGMPTLEEAIRGTEARVIREALAQAGGNREKAAMSLSISTAKLYRKLAVLNLNGAGGNGERGNGERGNGGRRDSRD